MSSNQAVEKKISRSDLKRVFWRSIPYNASFNYERQLNVGWAYAMAPILNKLYGDRPEELKKALVRNLEFSNITPFICTFLFGITIAMEEKNATDPDFDTESISATKVGLMGSLSAIGDSIFFGTIRVIGASIGCSHALEGNVLGPILYLLIFNIPNFISRYILIYKGYDLGSQFLTNIEKSGAMGKLFKGASILGLMVVGGMIALNCSVPITLTFYGTNLIDVINGVMPNLLNVGLFALIYWLLKKDTNVMVILVGIIVVAILGAAVGIF